MVLPSPPPNGRARRRLSPRKSKSMSLTSRFGGFGFVGIASFVFVVSFIGMWACIMFISPRISTIQQPAAVGGPARYQVPTPGGGSGKKIRGRASRGNAGRSLHGRKGATSTSAGGYSAKARVVGLYAYQLDELDDWTKERGKGYIPRYLYLTEKLDRNLLLHSSQTLRRIRRHDMFPQGSSLSDVIHNYKLAIAGSNSYIISEDPLKNLMLNSDSRDQKQVIDTDSEDYDSALAEPLNDEICEAAPHHQEWMLPWGKPTCNFLHEFDMPNSAKMDKTKILGNGYWRDVWPVLDSAPYSQKKAALKTIRYEHDFTARNFHRHVRDAIVAERLSSSPRVTSIFSFCGNSGYYEFASEGSLADRLEEHWDATVEAKDKDKEGRKDDESNDERLMDQHDKLRYAFEAAAGLADLHEADPLKDENGEIISASMVHADITPDQFVKVGNVYKLNDFNRCRFMRRYRNSEDVGGDGKPCGFHIGSNPGKNRSPEEYEYKEETDKIDVYSLGNIFYTFLTNKDPWEDESSEDAYKAEKAGKRPKVPKEFKSSEDPVNVALRKVMNQCWEHKPEDRPSARAVADFLSKELDAFTSSKTKTE